MAISVLGQGLAGIQSSQRRVVEAADQVVRAGTPGVEVARPGDAQVRSPVEPLVEIRRQEQLFTASAKVVSIADETLGSLIDVTS